MTKLKYACAVIWFGCALLTVSMLVADERAAPESALRWQPLAAIQAKYEKVKQMAYLLRTENKNAANADGSMSKEGQRDYLRKYEAELVSPEEVALHARGASNAGYRYLGCAKTFALMGKAFAEAILEIREEQAKINDKESPTP